MILEINIPMLPISVNSQYGKGGHGVYLTFDAKVYRKTVETMALEATRKQKWEFCRKGTVLRATAIYTMPKGCAKDVNNDKLTPDSLEGIVYENDKQVIEWRLIKIFGTNFQHTKVLVEKIDKNEHQEQIKKEFNLVI